MTSTDETQFEAHGTEVEIHAPPGRVYDLIADVTRMGHWSPECVRCRWIGRSDHAMVGARFRGTSRNGRRRWSTVSTVVVATPGQTFAFDVTYFRLPVATWRYDIRPHPDGSTLLAESVQDRRGRLLHALSPLITGSPDRASRNTETMKTTLTRVKAEAERTSP